MTDDPIPLEEARRRKAAQEIGVTPQKPDAIKGHVLPPLEEEAEVGSSQRDKLIACASAADLWHDADGAGYATLAEREHAEHHLLRSKGFRDWLRYRFYKITKGAPGAQPMQDALATLEAKARFEG